MTSQSLSLFSFGTGALLFFINGVDMFRVLCSLFLSEPFACAVDTLRTAGMLDYEQVLLAIVGIDAKKRQDALIEAASTKKSTASSEPTLNEILEQR